MKAIITKKDHSGKVSSNRKEDSFNHEFAVITKSLNVPITLRIYNTQSRSYACIWINDCKTGIHVSGGGYAGGYGYHRPSQAAKCAIRDSGIELDMDIGGRGDSAIRDALEAIARALGYRKVMIHESHA